MVFAAVMIANMLSSENRREFYNIYQSIDPFIHPQPICIGFFKQKMWPAVVQPPAPKRARKIDGNTYVVLTEAGGYGAGNTGRVVGYARVVALDEYTADTVGNLDWKLFKGRTRNCDRIWGEIFCEHNDDHRGRTWAPPLRLALSDLQVVDPPLAHVLCMCLGEYLNM